MSWPGIADSASSDRASPRTFWSFKRSMAWAGLAAAACLLLAGGMLLRVDVRGLPGAATEAEAYAQAADLLGRGQFDEARAGAAEAVHRGLESDRLRTVEAQALRRLPATLALACAGRLTDFGFEIGGVTARSTAPGQAAGRAEEALKVLARSGTDDDTVGLNRGHALLSLGRYREAQTEFEAIATRHPRERLAPLGAGLARFALADYTAAESAFRTCLQLDPDSTAARINLAMSLEEQGKFDEALTTWEQLLSRSLPDSDRQAILRQVEELRHNRAR